MKKLLISILGALLFNNVVAQTKIWNMYNDEVTGYMADSVSFDPYYKVTFNITPEGASKVQSHGYFKAGMTDFSQIKIGKYDVLKCEPNALNLEGDTTISVVCEIPGEALPGTFSISDTKKIQFSKGNLQYQPISKSWRFAEKQYDYVGEDNLNMNKPTYDGWLDRFGWGTSGYHDPTDRNSYYYEPYQCIYKSYSTLDNLYGYGPSTDKYTTLDNNNYDWGRYNTQKWRTLTMVQFFHIINGRPNSKDLRSLVTIDTIQGMMLLPDDWVNESAIPFTPNDTLYSSNIYTLEQWAILESEGAVFLPASGWHQPAMMGDPLEEFGSNKIGAYWTTSLMCNGRCSSSEAYCFTFGEYETALSAEKKMTFNSVQRYYGLHVRLVTDCE